MGIKKLFRLKPPPEDTPEMNREILMTKGITVKGTQKRKKEKFAAYGQFAKDKASDTFYSPEGYEQYAQPPAPEDPADDLNKSELDDENGTSKKASPKKKRGIFGRKKSSSQDTEGTEPKEKAYDPYAVNIDTSENFSEGPYSTREPSKNNVGDTRNMSDPYSTADPYSSSEKQNYNNDPYFSHAGASDPYNSTYNDRQQSGTDRSSPGINTREPYRGGAMAGAQRGITPRNASPNQPYSSRDTSQFSNPYGERNSGDNVSRSDSNDLNAPPVDNINLEKNDASVGGVPRRGTSNPYGNRGPTRTRGSATNVPSSSSPLAYGSTGANTGNPYDNIGATDMYGSSSRAVGGTSQTNPYESMNGRSMYTSPTEAPMMNTSKPNPYNIAKTNTYSLNDPPTETFTGGPTGPLSETVYASRENRVAANDTDDLNAPLGDVTGFVDNGDDLNAPLSDELGGAQQQQQQYQEQQPWQMEEEYQQQEQSNEYGNGYGQDKGYASWEEVQRAEEEQQQREEDEAVDELKQEIRFTKQSSVASTRNTLRMAQDAERSGMNTLGLLGHQSEKLNNVETNLNLIKVQNSVADEQTAELKKLNRSLWAVHVSNPFNSKRKKREREDAIKNKKIEEKMMMEGTNRDLYQSTQRIESAMNGNAHSSSGIRERYQREQALERAKKYQFENDEEDDEMELEIDRNISQIQQVSGRLKNLALAVGGEVDAQQNRLDNIENNTDDMDIKIHMNTRRLADIR
ncbi:Sec9p KNAG_0D03730 [Huiozyma naganishii CBS 8797]|uniref:t-SNARE coiled-coil homology domain-containing protein n=1 Tax=Huiozyma naganishii (strain ATCC MYA-139 / BCRC 22969 / CBS 8797 / KCTC 17520 / NBRC 10181 / NCYC 3082 / Yp74L-3) TaxID=1071383 RepID=J7S606_HUIN7|nr:hypothetical protein KNAG_0D03730 [Kazachstania naganishii CBS 8797]CCK70119.1 hypothetical protein KNAG_0D03730 [Kazachstania naganishii CBS 8797]